MKVEIQTQAAKTPAAPQRFRLLRDLRCPAGTSGRAVRCGGVAS